MVLDEINEANKSMGVSKKTKGKDKESERKKAEDAKAIAVKEWWEEATSLNPEELDKSIVRCDVKGSVSFMDSESCLSRGGTTVQ